MSKNSNSSDQRWKLMGSIMMSWLKQSLRALGSKFGGRQRQRVGWGVLNGLRSYVRSRVDTVFGQWKRMVTLGKQCWRVGVTSIKSGSRLKRSQKSRSLTILGAYKKN